MRRRVPGLRALGNVHVFPERGGYGDFSHVDRYLAAVCGEEQRAFRARADGQAIALAVRGASGMVTTLPPLG